MFAVLGAMLILTMLLFSLLGVAANSRLMSVRREDAQKAFEIAEGGLRHGARRLVKSATYAGETRMPLGGGTFDVAVASMTADPDFRLLTSTARAGARSGREMTRSVSAVVDLTPASRIWGHAIITEQQLNLIGDPMTNSEPTLGRGNIHSNSNMTISGSPMVNGGATAVGTIDVPGKPLITGGIKSNAPAVAFPILDIDGMKAKAAALGTRPGSLSLGGKGTYALKGVIDGDLTVSGGARLQIDGWLWVTGRVYLSGNGVTGTGALVAEQPIAISGNPSIASSSLLPRSLVLMSLSRLSSEPAITVSGNPTVDGSVFAPNGKVLLDGNPEIRGTVAAKGGDVYGNPRVIRNTGFDSPLIETNPARVVYWYGGLNGKRGPGKWRRFAENRDPFVADH